MHVSVVKDLIATVTQCADGTALCVFNTEYVAICVMQFKVTCKTLQFIVIMGCCKYEERKTNKMQQFEV